MKVSNAITILTFTLVCFSAHAQNYPAPKQGEWIAQDFRFHTGEVMPELRLAYTMVGEPTGQPVLILHGTGGPAASMLTPAFAGQLFGPGQPLDARKYFIILPDAIGHGRSSKPSDGLKIKFPKYNYEDMVDAQYRLITEGLGLRRLRLVLGNSMGGMHAWIWGGKYPDAVEALVPMASQPTAMASRNWMLRRLLIETIRSDPDYNDGNYTTQLRSVKLASLFYGIATSGGTLAYQRLAPASTQADKLIDERLAAPFRVDANDFIYAWESSRDYDPAERLERIAAPVLVINAADDERNPPETGLTEQALKRVRNGRLHLIPASDETRGHGTTAMAKLYKEQLDELLRTAPQGESSAAQVPMTAR